MAGLRFPFFFIFTPPAPPLPSLGLYLEQSGKDVRRRGRDSNGTKLIHLLWDLYFSNKYEHHPKKPKVFGVAGEILIKKKRIKGTPSRKTSFLLPWG